MLNAFKTFGQAYIDNDRLITMLGGIGKLVNGLSRTPWGYFTDKYRFKRTFNVLLAIEIILILIIYWSVSHWLFYAIIVPLSMMTEGAITTMMPTACLNKFGMKRGQQVFSYMFSIYGVSSTLTVICAFFFQATLGYLFMFGICLIMAFIAVAVNMTFRDEEYFDFEAA